MKIHVRRRHIVKGKRGKPRECPIALAIRDAGERADHVSFSYVWINQDYRKLPAIARRFIVCFDAGKPVKPFAFVLK